MSRDHYLLLCDVTADTENTASSIVACWTVFTELLPGNAVIKSFTILKNFNRTTGFVTLFLLIIFYENDDS
jgi:hypothetical protein